MNEEVRLLIHFEREAALLGDRLVKFADVARDEAGVEIDHAFAAGARLRARDVEEGVENLDQAVRFLDHLLQRAAIVLGRLAELQRLFGAPAQPRQRRLEIMRYIVGDLLQAGHQFADAIQHDVEVLHQPVEFVAGSGDRQPARKIAGDDVSGLWR